MSETAICKAILASLQECHEEGVSIVQDVIKAHGVSQKLREHLLEYLNHAVGSMQQAKAEITFYLELLEYEVHHDN